MDKETVDKKLKHEIEMFKVYTIFIIVIGTGNISLLLKSGFLQNKIEYFILISGVFIFLIFVVAFVQSFFKIKQLFKKL